MTCYKERISYFREEQMIISEIKSNIREIITVCCYYLSVDIHTYSYVYIINNCDIITY